MEKFVIVMVSDDQSGSTKYWNGRGMVEVQSESFAYNNKADARQAMASIVSVYSDYELSVRRATYALTIE